jgi:hypothetical protein
MRICLRCGFDAPPDVLLRNFFGRNIPPSELVDGDKPVIAAKVRELSALYRRVDTKPQAPQVPCGSGKWADTMPGAPAPGRSQGLPHAASSIVAPQPDRGRGTDRFDFGAGQDV